MPVRSYTPEQREVADQARREQVEQLHELLAERVGSLDNRAEPGLSGCDTNVRRRSGDATGAER